MLNFDSEITVEPARGKYRDKLLRNVFKLNSPAGLGTDHGFDSPMGVKPVTFQNTRAQKILFLSIST